MNPYNPYQTNTYPERTDAMSSFSPSLLQPAELPPLQQPISTALQQLTAPAATVAKITSAICKVMARVGVIEKAGTNEFFRYKFVQMQDVLQTLTPLMAEAGIAILQTEVKRELDDGGKALAVTYAFTVCHSSGEVWPERLMWTGSSIARNRNGTWDDKALNKCATAARKYCLLSLFQVPTGDEPDADKGENDGGDLKIARADAVSDASGVEQLSSQAIYDTLRQEVSALEQNHASPDALTGWARNNSDRFHQLNDEHRKAMLNYHAAAKQRAAAKPPVADEAKAVAPQTAPPRMADQNLTNDQIADMLEGSKS